MASNREIDQFQSDRLFDLLKLQKQNKGNEVKGLDEQILKAQASMTKESIAWVEQMIEKLNV